MLVLEAMLPVHSWVGYAKKSVCNTDQVMYLSGYTCLYLFYILFITYIAPILLSFTLHFSQFGQTSQQISVVHPVIQNFSVILPPIADSHVKLAFVLLFCYLIAKFSHKTHSIRIPGLQYNKNKIKNKYST